MNKRTVALLFIASLLLGGAWIWFSRVPVETAAAPRQALPLAGHPAPDFTLQTLEGESLSLSDLRGQAVVLNFWASWCGPCRAEMPELQQAYEDNLDGGLVVLAVNQGEPKELASDFMQRFDLTFPVVLDDRLTATGLYRTNSLPTTYFIDRNGIIREQVIGQMNTAVLEERMQTIYP